MDQETEYNIPRRGSKASGTSVVNYEPFNQVQTQEESREVPTISVDQDTEELREQIDEGNETDSPSLRPRFTTDTFESSYSNTRTNTFDPVGTNDDSYLYGGGSADRRDQEVLSVVPNRLNDKIPSSRPNVDYQDKLWTQIDVLDDVKRMSEQVKMDNNSFFNAEHSKAINELRLAQVELLSTIKNSERLVDANFDHKQIWDSTDIEDIRDKLYNKEYFDSIATGVDKVKDRLDDVGQSMKKIDELTRDIWQ